MLASKPGVSQSTCISVAQARSARVIPGYEYSAYVRECVHLCVYVLIMLAVSSLPAESFLFFLAKPQSWGAAPRFGGFPPKFTPGRAGPPSAPPAPKTCTVTQTYKSGSPAVSGGGEGQGVVLLGVPRNEFCKS